MASNHEELGRALRDWIRTTLPKPFSVPQSPAQSMMNATTTRASIIVMSIMAVVAMLTLKKGPLRTSPGVLGRDQVDALADGFAAEAESLEEDRSDGPNVPGVVSVDDRKPVDGGASRDLTLVLPDGRMPIDLFSCWYPTGRVVPFGGTSTPPSVVGSSDWGRTGLLPWREGMSALVFGPGLKAIQIDEAGFDGGRILLEAMPATRLVLDGVKGVEQQQISVEVDGYCGSSGPQGVGLPWNLRMRASTGAHDLPTVSGWVSIRATTGLGSAVWSGNLPVEGNAIVMRFEPTVHISGQVSGFPSGEPGGIVSVRLAGSHFRSTVGACTVDGDGMWTLPAVPWIEGGSYVLRLEHPGAVPFEAEAVAARPGDVLDVELHWELGERQNLKAVDPSGVPVPGAKVALQWSVGGSWLRDESVTDENGLTSFSSVPRGAAYLRGYKPGYARDAFGPYTLPLRGEEPILLELQPVGSVSLTFEGDLKPQAPFIVQYRPRDGLVQEQQFHPAENQSYLVQQVRVGETEFAVQSDGASSIGLDVVDVQAGKTTPVVVELAGDVRVQGQVLDAQTGEPVVDASLEAWNKYGIGPPSTGSREPVLTGLDGRYQGLLISPSGGFVSASASGMSSVTVHVDGPLAEEAEIPSISIQTLQPFRMRLMGRQQGFDGYVLSSPALFGLANYTFDSAGVSLVDGCAASRPARFEIDTPEPGFYQVEADLVLGEAWDIDLVVDAGRVVTVDLAPLQSELGAGWYHIRTEYRDHQGMMISHTHTAEEGLTSFEIRDIPLVNCLVTIARGKKWVGTEVFDLTEPGDHRVSVSLGVESIGFRLVTDSDEPIDNGVTGQFVKSAGSGYSWHAHADSDGTVEVQFAVPGPGTYYASRFGPLAFFRAPVVLPERGEEWPQVRFDLTSDAELSLSPSQGEPRPITVDLGFEEHWGGHRSLTTDSSGRLPRFRASEGLYRIQVTQPGYWKETWEFTLMPGENSIHFDVRPVGGLRVEVPLGGAERDVVVWSLADQRRVTDWEDLVASTGKHITDAEGALELPALPAGPYEVWIHGQRETSSELVSVKAGSVALVQLSL